MTCGVNEKSKYIIISARKYFALLCFYSNTICAQMTNPSKRKNSKKKKLSFAFLLITNRRWFFYFAKRFLHFSIVNKLFRTKYTSSKHRWSDMIVDIVGCTLFFVLRFRKKTVLVFNFYSYQWPKTSIRRYLFCCQYFSFPWLQYCTTEYPIGRSYRFSNEPCRFHERKKSQQKVDIKYKYTRSSSS